MRAAWRRRVPMILVLAACRGPGAPPATLSPAPVTQAGATGATATAAVDSSKAAPRPAAIAHGFATRGSDAQFNPLSVLLNEGFDQLRTSPRQNITHYPFGSSFKAVLRSVMQPDRSVRRYGVRNWLENEVFPLTLRGEGGGQWYPNYTLHLFGSGVTYMRLEAWYADHGLASHPRLAAGVTTFAYHFLNEAIENGPTADRGVDALTDLLVFDPAAIVLWNQRWVRGLFRDRFEVTNWNGQVSLGVPGTTIENAYSMVVLRAPLPRTRDWKVLVTHGYVFLVGVSRRVGTSSWITAGAGADAPVNPIVDTLTGKKTAVLERNAGFFFDHDGSLLASVVTRGGTNNGLTLNVYPGFLRLRRVHPSFWLQQNRGGGLRFGLSSSLGVGLSGDAGIDRTP